MANVTLVAPAGTNVVQGGGTTFVVAADGTVAVPSSLVGAMLNAGCMYPSTNMDSATFAAPPAADLVSIVAAAAPTSGTAMTIAAQPAYPCKLQVRGVYSGAVAGLVVNLVGVDGRGNAITETVPVAAAISTTFTTVNAYAKVTSVTPVGTVTNVTTIGVGQSSALAMPLAPQFQDFVCFKEGVAATSAAAPVDEAVGTVDTVAGTIVPTTAPNGTKAFTFWFTWNNSTY
jgi:hypothetical protein